TSRNLLGSARSLLRLRTPPFVYDMDKAGDKARLLKDMWLLVLTGANPWLEALFNEQLLDDDCEPRRFAERRFAELVNGFRF
ncbi:MAG: hypothetical protein SGPRY_011748, partial [Prymnesium sp.]